MKTKLLSPVKSSFLLLVSALVITFFTPDSGYNFFKVTGLYILLETICFAVSVYKSSGVGRPTIVYRNSRYYANVRKEINHFFRTAEEPYGNVERIIYDVMEAVQNKMKEESPLIEAFIIAILESENWDMKDSLEVTLFCKNNPEEMKMAKDFVETIN